MSQKNLKEEHDALVLFVTIFYVVYAFGIILIVCELGQRLTDAFEHVGDEFDIFEWYSFSLEIQRMLPTIIILSNQPIELECFGGISGSRETFKKVNH